MSVAQSKTELSFEQLVTATMKLPKAKLDELIQRINEVHPLYKEHRLSLNESKLLIKINQGVPIEIQNRYDALIIKRDNRTLTPEEYDELLVLTDQVELLDVKRMECLMELAKLRKMSLPLLMKELGISGSNHD